MMKLLLTEFNMGEELYKNIFDQLFGWAFDLSGGRVMGTIIILGIFYKIFEVLLLGTIKKIKQPKRKKQAHR